MKGMINRLLGVGLWRGIVLLAIETFWEYRGGMFWRLFDEWHEEGDWMRRRRRKEDEEGEEYKVEEDKRKEEIVRDYWLDSSRLGSVGRR